MTNDKPATFKYSIWDTRTSDQEPNIKVKSALSEEETIVEANQQTSVQEEE